MLNKLKHTTKLFSLSQWLRNKSCFLFFLLSFSVLAQENLIPNPSFEDYNWCPNTVTDFSTLSWYSSTDGTPDYFNSCNNGNVGVPLNLFGFQQAHSGNGYAGIGNIINIVNPTYREYIQVKLSKKLEAGKLYFVSFYFNLADSSRFSSNSIGVLLTENAFYENTIENLSMVPQVNDSLVSLNNSNIWEKVEQLYLADGTEEYLTIGCFENNNDIIENEINLNSSVEWYFYLDDVSLYEYELPDLPNVFSPNSDNINDEWLINLPLEYNLQIVNRWGELMFNGVSKNGLISWNGKDSHNYECTEGVYFYIISNKLKLKTGFIQLIR